MFKTIANSRSSWIHRLLRNIIRVSKCFFINSFSISWEFHSYHIDLGLEKYRMTGMEKLKLNLLRSYTSRTARLFKAAKLHINKHIVFEKLRIFYYVAHKNYLFQNGFPNWLADSSTTAIFINTIRMCPNHYQCSTISIYQKAKGSCSYVFNSLC